MKLKKNSIFVLADDLTGASEIGGIAFQFGLTVKILFNTERLADHKEDVIIIDSNSRNLKPEEAFQRITGLLSNISFSEFNFIYKKVDSVLRGPVSSELEAFTKILNYHSTLLIPANPSKKRIIRSGNYFIDEIPLHHTGFRFDPHFPRLSNNIREIITDSKGNIFTSVDDVHSSHNKIVIPDISTVDEIKNIAANLSEKEVLYGGGADFFREILSEKLKLTEILHYSKIELNSRTQFIIGSHSIGSRKTVNILGKNGYAVFRLPKACIEHNGKFETWMHGILEAQQNEIPVVITGPAKRLEEPVEIDKTGERIVEAAMALIQNLPAGSQVMMEGGETASSFFREMKWDTLLFSDVHGPGIVALINQAGTLKVVTKPGSYPWPETLFDQIKSLTGIEYKKKAL
jgi:uncharacterized protein YgbK (DUF1537 family)